MKQWLMDLPLIWAVIVAIIGYLGMMIWIFTRPKKYIYAGSPDQKKWRDLRWWAGLLILIQIAIYATLGI